MNRTWEPDGGLSDRILLAHTAIRGTATRLEVQCSVRVVFCWKRTEYHVFIDTRVILVTSLSMQHFSSSLSYSIRCPSKDLSNVDSKSILEDVSIVTCTS
jgi:hypothetical protein